MVKATADRRDPVGVCCWHDKRAVGRRDCPTRAGRIPTGETQCGIVCGGETRDCRCRESRGREGVAAVKGTRDTCQSLDVT